MINNPKSIIDDIISKSYTLSLITLSISFIAVAFILQEFTLMRVLIAWMLYTSSVYIAFVVQRNTVMHICFTILSKIVEGINDVSEVDKNSKEQKI